MPPFPRIRVVGAGTMGRGITQLAAGAGCIVELTDVSSTAVDDGVAFVSRMLHRAAAKGLTTAAEAEAAIGRIRTGTDPTAPSEDVDLVVEAVVERLDVKQRLFATLSGALPRAVLASNTSSLSITAIASVVADPSRVIGLHFFNPVPLMKIVEVVPGTRTSPDVLAAARAFVEHTGHTPVQAKDSPGFLVNLLGRGLPTEALAVLDEDVADAADIDRIVRDMLYLKMGPFELMDLSGLDVSHPVLESIWKGFYGDERLRPAGSTQVRVSAGLLGRKSGEGFYRYADGVPQVPAEHAAAPEPSAVALHIVGGGPLADLLRARGVTVSDGPSDSAVSVVQPLGRPAYLAAIEHGLDPRRTLGVDPLGVPLLTGEHNVGGDGGVHRARLAVIAPFTVDRDAGRRAVRALASLGCAITVTADGPAPVAQRIAASMVNVASMAAEKGLANPDDIDQGARLGLGYPLGPLAMGDSIGPQRILAILDGLLDYTGDPRYRASGWLRARADLRLSLLDPAARPHDLLG
ncbi:3-hydroxyacyl-CoA dehydrogenase NAD-binding domain-containing protein [Tomitella gaofuii]|uniref:3-hydroxyacyl-CoA dehydrogenase NAD-binding domain-containing protein n=1 Tax=Tomitella gaofuii TaxID=2760083 RepID=UPI001C70F23D|nr:3-hydroxyacyl-CoA dehydrogenase NAD-binding domain-containing protein [Tomitella gaofuii]